MAPLFDKHHRADAPAAPPPTCVMCHQCVSCCIGGMGIGADMQGIAKGFMGSTCVEVDFTGALRSVGGLGVLLHSILLQTWKNAYPRGMEALEVQAEEEEALRDGNQVVKGLWPGS